MEFLVNVYKLYDGNINAGNTTSIKMKLYCLGNRVSMTEVRDGYNIPAMVLVLSQILWGVMWEQPYVEA